MTMVRVSVILASFLMLSSGARAGESTTLTGYERELHLLGDTPAPANDMFSEAPLLQGTLTEKKSAGLAALYSLVLPGMGELYADGFSSGKYFLIADGLLWMTFVAFEVSGNSLRDDSRVYAVSRAGIDPGGKDDQFYVDIGNFLNTDEYNQKQLRDREPENLYNPAAGYGWQWDSDASRATYRDQRVASDNMYNNKKFVVAALIANRVASAINAVRSVISYNKAIDEALGDLRIDAGLIGGFGAPHGVLVTLTRSF